MSTNSTTSAIFAPGSHETKTLAIVCFVVFSIYYTVPAFFFLYYSPKYPHLAQRNVGLTLSMVIVTEFLIFFYLLSNLLYAFPCFLFFWISAISWPLILSSILFRSLRLVFLTRIHEYKSGSLVRKQIDDLVHVANTDNIDGGLEETIARSPPTGTLNFPVNSGYKSQQQNSRECSIEMRVFTHSETEGTIDTEMNLLPDHHPTTQPNQTVETDAVKDETDQLHSWWIKYRKYMSDFYLNLYQVIVVSISVIYCSFLTIYDPDLSPGRITNINDPNAVDVTGCTLSSIRVAIVPVMWVILFTFVGGPVILISTRKINDNYKIKRDLMASTITCALIFPISIIWNFVLPKTSTSTLNGSVFISWAALTAVNTVCILVPVIEAMRGEYTRISLTKTDAHIDDSVPNYSEHSLPSANRWNPKLTKSSFEVVLRDQDLFDKLKNYASRDFTTENILFVKAYLGLVEVYYFGNLQRLSFFEEEFRLPCTLVGDDLMPLYKAIYETFFKSGADLELNLSAKLMNKIRHAMIVAEDARNGGWLRSKVLVKARRSLKGRGKRNKIGGETASLSEESDGCGVKNSSPALSEISINILNSNNTASRKFAEVAGEFQPSPVLNNVTPVQLADPQIIGHGGRYGARSNASQSIHMNSAIEHGIPANLYDEAFRDVLEMLYRNTYSKWVKSERHEF
ncbi:hypothetical protein HK098_004196 [Nowakowskiella sp. JEL0407]|nr:hypothetical protein HK098_004196 [Nowakowskiella sp. JEL0407]